MFREGTKMAGGKRGRTGPGADPERLPGGVPDHAVDAVSAPAIAAATAAAVLGVIAAVISVLTLASDGSALHASIVALLYVPSIVMGAISAVLQRRFVAREVAALRAEISRRDDAQRRLADELERRGAEIADLTRRQQLLLAEDDLLRERMQESFVNLSMRSLTLVERQLDVIEKLEHTEENAQRLEDLFRLDHLATRMRRNSENVLVLADADERHGHRPPGTLLDVVRAAVSEIEYYERVDIGHIPRAELAGHTADDISHLLAELLENAAAYSPPSTRVSVAGRTLENRGILLTVEDEGFGVPPDRLPELNAQLQGGRAAAGASDLAGLGVFVVGALAVRHGLRVQLRPRREGGLAAIVMLPAALLLGSAPSAADISHERALEREGRSGAGRRPPAAATRSTLQERHQAAPRPAAEKPDRAAPAAEPVQSPEPPVSAPEPTPAGEAETLPRRRKKDTEKRSDSGDSPTTASGLPQRSVRKTKAKAETAAPGSGHVPSERAGSERAGHAEPEQVPSAQAVSGQAPPGQAAPGPAAPDRDASVSTDDSAGSPPALPKRWVARGMDETAQLRAIDPPAVGSPTPLPRAAEAAPLGSAATAAAGALGMREPAADGPVPAGAEPGFPSPTPTPATGTEAAARVHDAPPSLAAEAGGVQAGVTGTGLPKRVPRSRSIGAGPPEPAAPSVRDSGPVAAEELRRRLSGFQMGSAAARQAADDDIAAPGGEAR
ncbi:ATP-binding protein [Yinghuangia sp. YIM S09857]|uniref:sensor histidine kinase n=1 Tax=Yinghuangia sp. YIM S09857 TaxID=3436929 RepID=UPI003F539242